MFSLLPLQASLKSQAQLYQTIYSFCHDFILRLDMVWWRLTTVAY